MKKIFLLSLFALTLSSCGGKNISPTDSTSNSGIVETDYDFVLDEKTYVDKALGGLTGELWGNFSGLPTEFQYVATPNPNEVPWLVGESYSTDDDTSMEFVWTHIMETYGVDSVNYLDIKYEFVRHIRDMIWVGNEAAYSLMNRGYLPPETGKQGINPCYRAIDAQIESEIFGFVCPGMVGNAIERADWWMRTIGDGPAVDCASFYAGLVANLFVNNNIIECIKNVMSYYEDTSSAHEISEYVLKLYEEVFPGYSNWEKARSFVYNKYYLQGTKRNDTLDSEINFAITLLSLVYGENDFKKTGQIALRAGFDNDCNAATACLFMGIKDGYNNLPKDLRDKSGDTYYNTNRPGLADDTISNWANRLVKLGKDVVNNAGGVFKDDKLYILDKGFIKNAYNTLYKSTISIEDSKYAWIKEGFGKIFNPDLLNNFAYASTQKGSKLSVKFNNNHIYLYGLTCLEGGEANIYVDGKQYGFAMFNQAETLTNGTKITSIPTTIVKGIRGLTKEEHELVIEVISEDKEVAIEGIGFDISEEEYNMQEGVNLSLTNLATAIVSVPKPLGTGSGSARDINVIRDGSRNPSVQFDTFLGFKADGTLYPKDFEDYFGMTFSKEVEISKVVFVAGGHWAGGGWFANGEIRIEILNGDSWTTISSICDPIYPNGNTLSDFGTGGEVYSFTFASSKCHGVRVIGTPGGSQKLTSCAEFEVYK